MITSTSQDRWGKKKKLSDNKGRKIYSFKLLLVFGFNSSFGVNSYTIVQNLEAKTGVYFILQSKKSKATISPIKQLFCFHPDYNAKSQSLVKPAEAISYQNRRQDLD